MSLANVICCPSPDEPVIEPNTKTLKMRSALQAIMYGEIGAAIGRAYIFGFTTGLFHLVSMWIDYMGYATMHFCQVLVVAMMGGVEALMLVMNQHDGGPLEAAINRSSTTMVVYYVALAFAVTKMIACMHIQKAFQREFHRQHGGGDDDSYLDADSSQDSERNEQDRYGDRQRYRNHWANQGSQNRQNLEPIVQRMGVPQQPQANAHNYQPPSAQPQQQPQQEHQG